MDKYHLCERLSAQELLGWGIQTFGGKLAIATSFQAAGMVILDMSARISNSLRVLTLDTGRLPGATFQMMESVRQRYGIQVETVLPDPGEVEAMVKQHGVNLFYRDPGLRKLCCEIRKVRPLARKRKEFDAWVTGLRRSQNGSRADLRKVEEKDGLVKISPLADWTTEEVDEYIRLHNVPRHPLYDQGYKSIGCAPCTRAVEAGEDERAGRWWWEQDAVKECGIHFSPDGEVRRGLDVSLEEVLKGANA